MHNLAVPNYEAGATFVLQVRTCRTGLDTSVCILGYRTLKTLLDRRRTVVLLDYPPGVSGVVATT